MFHCCQNGVSNNTPRSVELQSAAQEQEGMLAEGTPVIRNAIDRPQTSCCEAFTNGLQTMSSALASVFCCTKTQALSEKVNAEQQILDLLALAQGSEFTQKEGVFRKSPSATKLKAALSDIPAFINQEKSKEKTQCDAILLAAVIKNAYKTILPNEEKEAFFHQLFNNEPPTLSNTSFIDNEGINTLLKQTALPKLETLPAVYQQLIRLIEQVAKGQKVLAEKQKAEHQQQNNSDKFIANVLDISGLLICLSPNISPLHGDGFIHLEMNQQSLISACIRKYLEKQ